jgi:hypothetical protein
VRTMNRLLRVFECFRYNVGVDITRSDFLWSSMVLHGSQFYTNRAPMQSSVMSTHGCGVTRSFQRRSSLLILLLLLLPSALPIGVAAGFKVVREGSVTVPYPAKQATAGVHRRSDGVVVKTLWHKARCAAPPHPHPWSPSCLPLVHS